jgi:xanthine/uracil permease
VHHVRGGGRGSADRRSGSRAEIGIANQYGGVKGLPYVYGAMMVSGVLGLILAKPFSMIIRFFPPLVAGTVICIIGLSLGGADISLIAPTVVNGANVAQVSHVVLAGIVILSIILISRLFTGFVSQIAVLLMWDGDADRRALGPRGMQLAVDEGAVVLPDLRH